MAVPPQLGTTPRDPYLYFFFSKVLGNKSLLYSLLILSRFDINWLKPQYRDLDEVKKLPDDVLPQISKRVIEGVHRRDYRKGLMAESPSKGDLESLDQAYGL